MCAHNTMWNKISRKRQFKDEEKKGGLDVQVDELDVRTRTRPKLIVMTMTTWTRWEFIYETLLSFPQTICYQISQISDLKPGPGPVPSPPLHLSPKKPFDATFSRENQTWFDWLQRGNSVTCKSPLFIQKRMTQKVIKIIHHRPSYHFLLKL